MKLREMPDGSPFPSQISYFLDKWGDLSEGGKDGFLPIGKPGLFGPNLFTAHAVLVLMEDELHFNGIRNQGIRDTFRAMLTKELKNVFEVSPNSAHGIKLVVDSINQSDGRLLSTVREALKPYKHGMHIQALIKRIGIQLNDSRFDEAAGESLAYLCNAIISELLIKGFSMQEIRKMEGEIEGHCQLMPFAFQVKEGEVASIGDKVVKVLLDKFKLTAAAKFVLFAVEGFRGHEDVTIGDVVIYNAEKNPKIRESRDLGVEKLSDEGINMLIPVSTLDIDKALDDAWHKAQRVLDFAHGALPYRTHIKVVQNKFIVLNAQMGLLSSGSFAGNEMIARLFPIALGQLNEPQRFVAMPKRAVAFNASSIGLTEKEIKVRECMAWLRKGDTSARADDALLAYWVAIEKLLTFSVPWGTGTEGKQQSGTKWDTMAAIIPSVIVFQRTFAFAQEFFSYLKARSSRVINGRPAIELPASFARDFGFGHAVSKENSISLRDFLERLNEIEGCETCPKLLKEHAKKVRLFYADRRYAAECLKSWKTEALYDLQILYRYRNSIVHNAHSDFVFLPQLRHGARQVLSRLLSAVLENDHDDSNENDVQAVLFTVVNRLSRLVSELERGDGVYDSRASVFWK